MPASVVLVMGVSGSGKSTVGRALADTLGYVLVEADDYHSTASVARMREGVPLDDAARLPWLHDVHDAVARYLANGDRVVIACSALKHTYRDVLLGNLPDPAVVYLRGDRATIERRLRGRAGHFMPPTLLDSQFEALEEPAGAIIADVATPVTRLVRELRGRLAEGDPGRVPRR